MVKKREIAPPHTIKMILPQLYQTTLRTHLNEKQYITLQLLLLLIQVHRQVSLSVLASVFPQPIQRDSRRKNLKRFLSLPQLNIKLLWFPLIKDWISQEKTGCHLNRQQRRIRKLKNKKYQYWILAVDRTQWKNRNLFIVSIIWGTHALPLYWELLPKRGNSSLKDQERLLKNILPLFKDLSVLVLADREFHSPKLANWLDFNNVSFVLRQKKTFCFQEAPDQEYKSLQSLGFMPGMSKFYKKVLCNKGDEIGPYNVAVYWKRKYRNKKASKDPWYILTNLGNLKEALAVYRCRWGIEQMFKDCKSGGYNLEKTRVNETRFMALMLIITMAYCLATLFGQRLRELSINKYAERITEYSDKLSRHSEFSLGGYGQRWCLAMETWKNCSLRLMALKPHKWLYFQRGLAALSLMQQEL